MAKVGRPKNPYKKTPGQKLFEYKKKHPKTTKTLRSFGGHAGK